MSPAPIPIHPSCVVPVGLKRGDKGPGVRVLQEWLTLADQPVIVDGDFGPATERALDTWRRAWVVRDAPAALGPVSAFDAAMLVEPMRRALAAKGSPVDIARAHLKEHPREVGGQNRGPWVRTFTGGFDGPAWAWCAYAARLVARQAGDPWWTCISPNCDILGRRAREDGRLSTTPTVGGLFLVRGPSEANPWTHTGIVMDAGPGWVSTWEGNSNDEGSREGHEVCSRTRGVSRLDFVRLGT